jgi:hypothetical protein
MVNTIMNNWTVQKWRLLTKCPTPEVWNHAGPSTVRTSPVTTRMMKAAMEATPNT